MTQIKSVKKIIKPYPNGLNVGDIIRQLMDEVGLKEVELARKTGVPQTTINRLLLGDTIDPRTNTLRPLANFFGITIGQLIGDEPLNSKRTIGSFNVTQRSAWSNVPIIPWEAVLSWKFKKNNYTPVTHHEWVMTERAIGDHSYALKAKPFMEPRFRKDCILIIDPEAKYEDGHFIVITLNNKDVTVRQIVKDNGEIYLKNFDSSIPTIKFDQELSHSILGTIIESRVNHYGA